jgi:hypothetical protein
MKHHYSALAMVTLAIGVALAQDTDKPATGGSGPVHGTWNLSVQTDHVFQVGMVLKQDGKAITGTLLMPGGEVELTGSFEDGALTLAGEMPESNGHGGKIKLAGKLQEDGTLAGEFGGGRANMKWTAERLKKKRQ